MLKKKTNTLLFLIIGITSILLGLISLIKFNIGLKWIVVLLCLFIIIKGIIKFPYSVYKKQTISIIICIIDIVFGSICILFYNFLIIVFSKLFGVYLMFISLTHLVNCFIYFNNNIKGKLYVISKFIVTYIFSLLLLLRHFVSIKYLCLVFGIYLILFGLNNITNFITEITKPKFKDKIKRSINIQLPIILTAFIPKKLISLINELIQTDKSLESKKNNKTNNLQVLIHLSKTGSASLGHVEVAFNNKIYSYGNYNKHSRKLFDSIGDGIILIADKKKYINYCIKKRDRIIVEFGISLTDKEINIVEERINTLINTDTIDYYSDLQLYEKGIIKEDKFKDMSSEIYKYADGNYKKITKGKYKKFFVLKTNCVMVVQYILSSIGKEVLAINGILSPGAYYEYLNERFNMKNTNIISRKIYVKKR